MYSDARRAHVITAFITLIGAACCLLQAVAPFRGALQFLTVQVIFVAGALTYARALRWLLDPEQSPKARLILRGNFVVLASVAATLILDCIAQYQRPRPSVVVMSMVFFGVLVVAAQIALALAFRRMPTPPHPAGLTIADGIDDLLVLIRWAGDLELDRAWDRLRLFHPRLHPWGFAFLLGLAAGLGFFVVHLEEGLPPGFRTGLAVVGLFMGIELAATLLGFAALGPYLGLRDAD